MLGKGRLHVVLRGGERGGEGYARKGGYRALRLTSLIGWVQRER